ncbi:MAG TPA: hypothetical protein VG603_12560 [Chitinophagales bacterium]|nr:hypothetical protein [Chitinophagales bacterium]
MKNRPVLFSVLALALLITGCHIKAKQAKKYHDDMMAVVSVVVDSSLNYGDAIQSGDKQRAETAYKQYSGLVNKSIEKVQTFGDFQGDTTLRSFSLELLDFYKSTLDSQFGPFLASVKKDNFTAAESQRADSLYSKMTMTENQYWQRFDWAEKKFYKEHDIAAVEEKK